MDVLTVSLFGHREIEDLRELDNGLTPIVRELVQGEKFVSFLIGRNGEFDEYAASILKRVQKEVGKENCEIMLVLPYKVKDIEYYEKYYDSVIIPENLSGVYHKAAITRRNEWMIEKSELVIAFVRHEGGGAFAALKYAKKLGKSIKKL